MTPKMNVSALGRKYSVFHTFLTKIHYTGDEGLVRLGGEIPGHEVRGPHLSRGLQEGHDREVPENSSGMREHCTSYDSEGQS